MLYDVGRRPSLRSNSRTLSCASFCDWSIAMISQATTECDTVPSAAAILLVRYGNIPQVAKFQSGLTIPRGTTVVCRTDRGEELGTVLEQIPGSEAQPDSDVATWSVLRAASLEDQQNSRRLLVECETAFSDWLRRIQGWKMELELIDLERTLDGKLILYVLNDRGPETTRLGLLAAANGMGIVHVQPVNAQGIITGTSGGCSSCGCGHKK
ncbi:MAG: hypothetical protein KDA96_17770 [Planctomycetaceae bacterium]|nr:hypothetical protein [Planctomycetaceae bacterium]